MNALAVLGALAIGLSLGLTGAGGSILTLPVLVYLAGVPPGQAVGLSLFVVGVAALTGAVGRWRRGDFHPRAALTFGLAGMGGAALGSRFTDLVSPFVLMTSFAVLMVFVAVRMLTGRRETVELSPECRPVRCLLAGTATGLLTGFLGVGGGFLLVPALMRFAHLPLAMATGTSLAIISTNSLAGWLSHLPESVGRPDLMFLFAALAVLGTMAGKHLGTKLPVRHLRTGFALMVLATGGFVLWQSLKGQL